VARAWASAGVASRISTICRYSHSIRSCGIADIERWTDELGGGSSSGAGVEHFHQLAALDVGRACGDTASVQSD
jgi:hypothetical protein